MYFFIMTILGSKPMMMLQDLPGQSIAESQFEKITNPILGILILLLIGILVYMGKQNNAKDTYIKELHNNFADYAIKNTEVLRNLENTIKVDDAAHRALETLIRENNSYLQTIVRNQS